MLLGLCCTGAAEAITIEVRYDLDDNQFFTTHPAAKDALEFAAKAFEPLADSLTPITLEDELTAVFSHPATGGVVGISNLTAPAETVVLYAGARDLAANEVGQAAPGGGPAAIISRGQGTILGAGATDFGLWGGSVAFDTKNTDGTDRNWHFDPQTNPAPGQVDFLSIALHELGHLFGFGTSDSFANQVSAGEFVGPATVALVGQGVPVTADQIHWANGTDSPPYANPPETAFDPSIVLGRRKVLTPLDYAGLKDVGWEAPDALLALPGDFNSDAQVDGDDFLVWQNGLGLAPSALLSQGDADGSGQVDDYDFWLWQQNFGQTSLPIEPLAAATIPEPATYSLLLMAAAGLLASLVRRSPSRAG